MNNNSYIIAVVVMFLIGVAGIIGIGFIRPDVDILLIMTGVFGVLTLTTVSLLALLKAQETHLSVNSRLDAFIKQAGLVQRAEGVIEGREEANKRTDSLKKD